MAELPRAARLALAFNAWTAHALPLDEVAEVVVGSDAAHDVVTPDGLVPITWALPRWRDAGTRHATVVLPEPGDLGALAGPVAVNEAALDAGEAVLLDEAGLALVPDVVGGGVFWNELGSHPPRHVGGLSEVERRLREELVETARVLTNLDAARWRPEVAEVLASVREDADSLLPDAAPARAHRVAALAQRCLVISDLALHDDGAADSAAVAQGRRTSLRRLDQAARLALAAACSEPVGRVN